jgi:hypothetical protein
VIYTRSFLTSVRPRPTRTWLFFPATPSIDSRYKNDVLNPAFASRLEDVIEQYHPDLWIHGHTHVHCDYEICGTRVVCNPRGYPSEPTGKGFSPGLVVEV